MADSFAHLHVHTEYSMLDGAARLKDMFAEANGSACPPWRSPTTATCTARTTSTSRRWRPGSPRSSGVEAYVAPESRLSKKRVKWGGRTQKERRRLRQRRATPTRPCGRATRTGLHNLFTAQLAGVDRGALRQVAPDGHGADRRARRGDHGHHRLPVRRGADPAAAGPVRRGAQGAAEYQDIFGKENYFLEIMDHGLDIERRVREGLTEIAASGHPAGGHQRLALHPRGAGRGARRAAVRADRQQHRRPEPVPVRRRRLLPQVRRPDARRGLVRAVAAGLPQHPAGGREGRHRRACSSSTT